MPTSDQIKAVRRWGSFPRQLRRMFLAQGGVCPQCGKPIDPHNRRPVQRGTKEHVQPKSLGGAGGVGNVVVAHDRCNFKK